MAVSKNEKATMIQYILSHPQNYRLEKMDIHQRMNAFFRDEDKAKTERNYQNDVKVANDWYRRIVEMYQSKNVNDLTATLVKTIEQLKYAIDNWHCHMLQQVPYNIWKMIDAKNVLSDEQKQLLDRYHIDYTGNYRSGVIDSNKNTAKIKPFFAAEKTAIDNSTKGAVASPQRAKKAPKTGNSDNQPTFELMLQFLKALTPADKRLLLSLLSA